MTSHHPKEQDNLTPLTTTSKALDIFGAPGALGAIGELQEFVEIWSRMTRNLSCSWQRSRYSSLGILIVFTEKTTYLMLLRWSEHLRV